MAYQQPYFNGGYYPQYSNGAMPDMLNQYKGQYQQPIPQIQQNFQPMQMPTQQNETQKINSGFIWVQGEAGAKAYLVAPNVRIPLWDSEDMFVYIKEADNTGKMSTKKYRLVDETDVSSSNSPQNAPVKHECKCGDRFATKEQINALQGKIDDLEAKLRELAQPIVEKPKTKTTKKGDVE